jgi:hypothetical protein
VICTPAGGWYTGVIEGHDEEDPYLVVLASSPGHPLQPGDRIQPPPVTAAA